MMFSFSPLSFSNNFFKQNCCIKNVLYQIYQIWSFRSRRYGPDSMPPLGQRWLMVDSFVFSWRWQYYVGPTLAQCSSEWFGKIFPLDLFLPKSFIHVKPMVKHAVLICRKKVLRWPNVGSTLALLFRITFAFNVFLFRSCLYLRVLLNFNF